MKKFFIIVAMLLSMPFTSVAQDSITVEGKNIVAPSSKRQSKPGVDTGYTYEIKGVKYKIYKTEKGKFYIERISKDGKQYKQYITDKVQNVIK